MGNEHLKHVWHLAMMGKALQTSPSMSHLALGFSDESSALHSASLPLPLLWHSSHPSFSLTTSSTHWNPHQKSCSGQMQAEGSNIAKGMMKRKRKCSGGDGGRWKSVLGGRRCEMKANEATWWEEMERVMTHLKWRVNERKWQNHEGKQKHLKTGGILKITTRGECSKMEWKRRGNLQTHTHTARAFTLKAYRRINPLWNQQHCSSAHCNCILSPYSKSHDGLITIIGSERKHNKSTHTASRPASHPVIHTARHPQSYLNPQMFLPSSRSNVLVARVCKTQLFLRQHNKKYDFNIIWRKNNGPTSSWALQTRLIQRLWMALLISLLVQTEISY